MLVEKLCHRFSNCASIKNKADLAYCLSQLKISEKCIKILNDLFKCYKDALFDTDVFSCMMNILKKARSFASPTMKECLEEWEGKLTSENESGVSDFQAANKAEGAKKRAAKRVANKEKRVKGRVGVKKKSYEESEEEEEEEGEEGEKMVA